ncbi:MAG TPA: hypothetical protein PLL07_09920 [Nitrosomonas sp.]|nr:hypothetical protein [Nitrosomonas sp.]
MPRVENGTRLVAHRAAGDAGNRAALDGQAGHGTGTIPKHDGCWLSFSLN